MANECENSPEWKEASVCYRERWRRLNLKLFFIIFAQFWINFHSFTWHWLDLYFITKSTKNPCSNFRINNCFCQIPLQSVFEVLFKLILDDFTLNKFVFRTRGSLLLSELGASSRIRHGGSPLSASHRKCILLSEAECHIINNLLTELARAVLGNIGPRSWKYGPRFARSALPRPRANIPQHGPPAWLVSG